MSRDFRVLLRGGLSPLALLLLANVALAQTPPQPGPAPAKPAATPAKPGPARPTPAPASPEPALPAPPAGAPTAQPGPHAPGGTFGDGPDINPEIEARFEALRSGKGLTSDEVARRTLKNSPVLEAKQRAVEGAEHGIEQARAEYWPGLRVSAAYTRLSPISLSFGGAAFKFPENSYSFDAALTVPISDYVLRTSHVVSAASHQRDAAFFDQLAQNASVARDARLNYYQWVRAQAQELVVASALEQAKGHQKDAENGFQVGLTSKADVLRTQAGVTAAELLIERAKNATELARVALQVGMGDTSEQAYGVGENVFEEAPELSQLPPIDAAFQEALGKRAEIKSLLSSERSARQQATAARVADYPRLDGSAAASIANPNQRYFIPDDKFHTTWQAGLVLSWTPTAIPGAEAAGAIADSKAAELIAQRRGVRDSLRLEVENAIKSAAIAKSAIESNTETLVSVKEAYRVRRELFRAGRATLVEVTDAANDLNVTRLNLADSYVEARIAVAQLQHALGRDVPAVRDAGKPQR